MPSLRFVITAELEKTSGKFIGKEDLEGEILTALEGADPGSVDVDDSSYDVIDWTVDAENLKVVGPKEATNKGMATAEPAPRIHRLIHDYIKLEEDPDGDPSGALTDKLTESLEELVSAFPKVADAIKAQLARERSASS